MESSNCKGRIRNTRRSRKAKFSMEVFVAEVDGRNTPVRCEPALVCGLQEVDFRVFTPAGVEGALLLYRRAPRCYIIVDCPSVMFW